MALLPVQGLCERILRALFNRMKVLALDSPFVSAIVLFGFWWFSRKDPWKEWGSYP